MVINTGWRGSFDERQRKEILFAETYLRAFDHGTPGALSYSVIAKQAAMLDAHEAAGRTLPSFPYQARLDVAAAEEWLKAHSQSAGKLPKVVTVLAHYTHPARGELAFIEDVGEDDSIVRWPVPVRFLTPAGIPMAGSSDAELFGVDSGGGKK